MDQTEADKDTEALIIVIANLLRGGARLINNSLVLTNEQISRIHQESKRLIASAQLEVQAREYAESELNKLFSHLGFLYGDYCHVVPRSLDDDRTVVLNILHRAGIEIDVEQLALQGNQLFEDLGRFMVSSNPHPTKNQRVFAMRDVLVARYLRDASKNQA